MTNKNTDIYKIVEEMDRQKKNASANVDEVFSQLDKIQDVEVNDVKNTVNSMNSSSSRADELRSRDISSSRAVKRPILVTPKKDYDSRYNCFMDMIANVDYGSANSKEYVDGHKAALAECIRQAENNPDDLYMVEAMVNDESDKTRSSNLYNKGYRDGLTYAYQALKYSKAAMVEKIYKDLRNNL